MCPCLRLKQQFYKLVPIFFYLYCIDTLSQKYKGSDIYKSFELTLSTCSRQSSEKKALQFWVSHQKPPPHHQEQFLWPWFSARSSCPPGKLSPSQARTPLEPQWHFLHCAPVAKIHTEQNTKCREVGAMSPLFIPTVHPSCTFKTQINLNKQHFDSGIFARFSIFTTLVWTMTD